MHVSYHHLTSGDIPFRSGKHLMLRSVLEETLK